MTKFRNRKTIIKDGWIDYKDEKIEICNSSNYGVYKDIILTFIEQLDRAISIHRRVLVIRLDFHMNYYTSDNKIFSNYLKNIKQFLLRNYNIKDIAYQWVREQEKSKKQHYHFILVLDGNKIRYSKKLINTMQEKWLPYGYIFIPKNHYYFIDKNNLDKTRKEVIYRASYFAKSRGKKYRPKQTKDYNSSRLKYIN